MSFITKTAAVLVATGALIGIASLSSTADAAGVKTGRSQGFHIYNESGDPLTLKNIAGDQQYAGAPKIGSVLQPGEMADFEVQYMTSYDQQTIRYVNAAKPGTAVDVRLTVEGGTIPSSDCVLAAGYDCSRSFWHQKEITISDHASTVHELSGDASRKQAALVRQLCKNSSLGTCDFSPETMDTHAYTRPYGLGTKFNGGEGQADGSVKETTAMTDTNSFDISVEVGSEFDAFGQKVDLKVSTTWGHETSVKKGFETDFHTEIPPHTAIGYWAEYPVHRVTGTLTMTLGKTTWILHDVSFDYEDHTRDAAMWVKPCTMLPTTPAHADK